MQNHHVTIRETISATSEVLINIDRVHSILDENLVSMKMFMKFMSAEDVDEIHAEAANSGTEATPSKNLTGHRAYCPSQIVILTSSTHGHW